jgi:tetratricopeptide (TPR) repeat protein
MAGFPPAIAAHAAVGTPVADAQLPALGGGKARLLADADASVLVFFRTNQGRSVGALRELAQCRKTLEGKPARWVGVVPDTAAAKEVEAMVRDSGFSVPVLVDTGDAVYGSLGLALHPVVVIVGRDRKLAAFEPFQSVDFCAVVSARLRHALQEISDEELKAALSPPPAVQGGPGQVAKRYRSLAEALYKAGSHDKALENARKSVEQDPGVAASHALIGDILSAQGKCESAVASYAQALALDSANAAARQGSERCKAAR